MKKSLPGTFSLIAFFFAVNSVAAIQESQDALAAKVDLLFAEQNTTDSPGVAVLVVRDGKVLLRRGYGMANLEHKIPLTPTTVFDIASVSKQVTGMAVSILVEQEKISLEDDIRKYIPELHDFGHTITIDHLVHHTSGLRDWPATLALAGWRLDDVISFDQILHMAFKQQDLNFVPGSEYSYSNTGYNLLVELIQRVTGQTFRQWTDENIFQPLGMTDTHFHDDHTEVVANKAYGYSRDDEGQYHAVPDNLTALGSSSLYTTIDDLARWAINLDGPKVGGSEVIERMLQRGTLNDGKLLEYAFGLRIDQYRGVKTISHGGSWAAFLTCLVYFPDQHFSVVVLMNYSPSNANKAAYDIVDIYLADELKPVHKDNAKEKPSTKAIEVPIEVLDEYVGTYRLGAGWYVTITREGEGLMAYATAEKIVPMTARTPSTFWVDAYRSSVAFERDDSNRVTHFLYRGMTCPKLEDVTLPGLQEQAELCGEYVSEELETRYTIALEDDQLVAKHMRHGTIRLTRAWKNDFRGGVWFMRSVVFYRDKKGRIAGFKVTQDRSRNQRFIKRF